MKSVESVSAAIGVELIPCESSNIVAYGWANNTLWILFKGDNLYKYPNQGEDKFVALKAASSKGKWVNENLVKQDAKCVGYDVT